MLFTHEERIGARFGHTYRNKFDEVVVSLSSTISRLMNIVGKDSIRQIAHYLLHTFLKSVLYISKRWETILRNLMHANKTIAKKAERERTSRSKLEEIAMHKIKTALSEEEKRKYKEKLLHGE